MDRETLLNRVSMLYNDRGDNKSNVPHAADNSVLKADANRYQYEALLLMYHYLSLDLVSICQSYHQRQSDDQASLGLHDSLHTSVEGTKRYRGQTSLPEVSM